MEISDISEVIEDNNEDEHQELGDQDGSQILDGLQVRDHDQAARSEPAGTSDRNHQPKEEITP